MMQPTPYYMGHFQVFNKIDSFFKNVLNVFGSKKGRFEEPLNLNVIVS